MSGLSHAMGLSEQYKGCGRAMEGPRSLQRKTGKGIFLFMKINSKSWLGIFATAFFGFLGSKAAEAGVKCYADYFDNLGNKISSSSMTCQSAFINYCSCSGSYMGTGTDYELQLTCNYTVTHESEEWYVSSAYPFTSCKAWKVVTR